MPTNDSETAFGGPVRPTTKRSRFFLIASVLMTLVVFAGFLPSFYLRPAFRAEPLPGRLVVHGVIMTLWQLLFLTQNILIAIDRPDLHRRLGVIGAGLAGAVVVAGFHTTLGQPAAFAARGVSPAFPLADVVISNIIGFAGFGALIAIAIMRRRDAATHKRLIYWSCVVTMGPALTSMRALGDAIGPYFPATYPPEVACVWIAWIALLIHDWRSTRRFHPASVVGGFLFLFAQYTLLDYVLLIEPVGEWVRALA